VHKGQLALGINKNPEALEPPLFGVVHDSEGLWVKNLFAITAAVWKIGLMPYTLLNE